MMNETLTEAAMKKNSCYKYVTGNENDTSSVCSAEIWE